MLESERNTTATNGLIDSKESDSQHRGTGNGAVPAGPDAFAASRRTRGDDPDSGGVAPARRPVRTASRARLPSDMAAWPSALRVGCRNRAGLGVRVCRPDGGTAGTGGDCGCFSGAQPAGLDRRVVARTPEPTSTGLNFSRRAGAGTARIQAPTGTGGRARGDPNAGTAPPGFGLAVR